MNRMIFLSIDSLEAAKNCEVELRLDLFKEIDRDKIKKFLKKFPYPVLLTLRKASHGGAFSKSEEQRERIIRDLLSLQPPFFDLEYDIRPEFLQELLQRYTQTNFVLSYHNLKETPVDLQAIYQDMQRYRVYGYKIACVTHSTNDALKMLLLAKRNPKVSAICMGEKGRFARIIGLIHNQINYAAPHPSKKVAPGQLSIEELSSYCLDEKTSLYGLIGDPVDKSPGDIYHNALFLKEAQNALYVKMAVLPDELAEFIPLATALGFKGLSVTIPLKEKIVSFVEDFTPPAESIGAVNTLLLNATISGTNTDGRGALDAIEKRGTVKDKNVVIIGAGGTARAIAYEAKRRGGEVTVVNRTVDRAKIVANSVGCEARGLEDIPLYPAIIVNCTGRAIPIDFTKVEPTALVMDVVYAPRETEFLKLAKERGCSIIYGEEMFINQAEGQREYWLK